MPALLRGWRILVVDDNMHIQAIWQAILSAVDAVCIGAHDTSSARTVLTEQDVDIVIVDEHLDDQCGNGAMLIAWIRSHPDPALGRTPILVCTSDSSEQSTRRLQEAGADLISFKPIVPREVLPALAQLQMKTPVRRSEAPDRQAE